MKSISGITSRFSMQKVTQVLHLDQAQGDGLRAYLIRGTTGVFLLQALSTFLGFLTNVLLARFLGVAEYGVYTYVFAWVGILTVLAMFGFGSVLIREIAAYQTQKQWDLISGILRWVGIRALFISIGLASSVAMFMWFFRIVLDPRVFPAMWLALLMLPVLTFFNLNNLALEGNKKVILARVTGVLIRAPLYITLLAIVLGSSPQLRTASTAILLSLGVLLAALAIGLWLLYKTLPVEVVRAIPKYRGRVWLRSALPLLLVAGLYELNTRIPILMLGSLSGPESVGFYSIATLITAFISFILISVNATIAPIISNLYTSHEMQRLQRIITSSTRIMLMVSLVVALLIILFRNWLLHFFGPGFQQADLLLILLSVGQLVNVFAGSVGTLLVMTGQEKKVVQAVGISTFLIVILNSFFIPRWSINGAGFVSVIGLMVWNFILIYQVHNKLGIDPTPFGRFSKWSER